MKQEQQCRQRTCLQFPWHVSLLNILTHKTQHIYDKITFQRGCLVFFERICGLVEQTFERTCGLMEQTGDVTYSTKFGCASFFYLFLIGYLMGEVRKHRFVCE